MPHAPKWLLWALAGAVVVICANDWLARRHIAQASERVVTLREQIRTTDTLYARDTVLLRKFAAKYRTIRDTMRITDTVAVKAGFIVADSALAACDTALKTGERRVALRDSLTKAITASLQPQPLHVFAEAYTDQTYRVGASLRVVRTIELRAEVEQRRDVPLTGRLGARVVF